MTKHTDLGTIENWYADVPVTSALVSKREYRGASVYVLVTIHYM